MQLGVRTQTKSKRSVRQQFKDTRNEPSSESPESWDERYLRRTSRKTKKPTRFQPGITSNFVKAEKIKQLNMDPVDIFKVNQVKANTVPSSYFKALNSTERDQWEAAYMKEVNKFVSVANCKRIHKDKNTTRSKNIPPCRVILQKI
eukprot:snap_masked-scaffold_1-processed-gene-16.84-mRNA-1 protein AED:1.00 eAED:1.00 QI:0/-1/0/0/-1/1/1/0/145